ncbi:MAG: hypothetical protein EXQ69_03885 [Acidimicrobiia bacterium]|nr:hypothetical protein [Acidimicrobiia bacterium]
MSLVRSLLVCFGAAAFGLPALLSQAGATAPESVVAARSAVEWLEAQQQPDGSFEVAGFPGFETPDAVLAIAEQAQADGSWSTAEALAGVEAIDVGPDALDALDDLAEAGLSGGQAAKLMVLDVAPLGLDALAFDPQADGNPVDLESLVASAIQPDGSYGAFNATLFAVISNHLTGAPISGVTIALIEAAQQANGAWNYAGDPTGTDVDPDTTGLAMQALIAGGASYATPSIGNALKFLAASHQADGSWPGPFDSGNPNSTALAIQGIVAAGYDPASPCWRNTADSSQDGTPYTSPDEYLISTQTADGNLASPSDLWGLNTFATSQGVQGLLRLWLPVARSAVQTCSTPPTTVPTSTPPTTISTTQPTTPATAPATTPAAAGPDATPTEVGGNVASTVRGVTATKLPKTGGISILLAVVGVAVLAIGVGTHFATRRRRA